MPPLLQQNENGLPLEFLDLVEFVIELNPLKHCDGNANGVQRERAGKMETKPNRKAAKNTGRNAADRPLGAETGAGARIGGAAGCLKSPACLAAVVFLFSFLLYANTIGHSFVWDDFDIIVRNEAVRTLDTQTVKYIFTHESWPVPHREGRYYRPLVTLSYHLNYQLAGENPKGFHLANVLLNSVVCTLVFLFVWLLFRNTGIGFVSALLFAAHPTHTESVAWVAGRTDVIATLWMLVSLICYVLFKKRRRLLPLVASLVAFFLALLSKELAVCLLLVVGLLELGPFERVLARPGKTTDGGTRRRDTFFPLVLFLCVLGLFLILRQGAIGTLTWQHPPIAPGTLGRMALPLSIFAGYVFKVFFPVLLNGEYDAPVPGSFAHPHVVAGAILLVVVLWGTWRFRRVPAIVLGTGIFLFGLGPVLNVIPIGEVSADRFLYFPSLGVALVLGWVFSSALFSRRPEFALPRGDTNQLRISRLLGRNLSLLFLVVLLLYVGRTVTRNRDWRNNAVFYAKTVAQSPNSPRAHVNFGNVAREKGDIATAVVEYETAIRLEPNDAEALSNLGGIYARQNKYDEAIRLLERALATWSDNAQLNKNLGMLYLAKKQYGKAEQHIDIALTLDPDDIQAHFVLGLLRVEQRDLASARHHFERAIDGGPEFHMSYYHLAVIERDMGNDELARRYARQFLAGYAKDDDIRKAAKEIAREE